MSAKTIRNALGLLQDDPEHSQAWGDLIAAVGFSAPGVAAKVPDALGMDASELALLLEAARRQHERRREYDAVARLLEIEVSLAHGSPRAAELQRALARICEEELLDDDRARAAYEVLGTLDTNDVGVLEAIDRSDAKRARWQDLVKRYVDEAKETSDPSFRSSLLVSAAEVAFRYGRPQVEGAARDALVDEIIAGLKEAVEIDPQNRRAELLLERVYRDQGRSDELAGLLARYAEQASDPDEKVSGYLRLARLSKKLGDSERAERAYQNVLEIAPTHHEATSALVDLFTARGMWDQLVALYDAKLQQSTAGGHGVDAGMLLQVAMVHWKMRGRPELAEPYFERLRKAEPAHPGMLAFFREWCSARGELARLSQVLTDAQRALPDGDDKNAVAAELARLAEEGANAAKAIERWRALLRKDAGNRDARDALKRLYRQTAGWNALTDLLRSDLDRTPADDVGGRLAVLREIAAVYRDHIKSDSALVTVLSQITQLDPTDADAVRELARVFEALGRFRDLLAMQTRLAELEPDAEAKAELYRAVGRRWLEQFSNVQNALDAFEKLRRVMPSDREAFDKLRELYVKRRAYKALYELLESEAAAVSETVARRELFMEMAKLAAERLDRGADALAIYKRVLEAEPAYAPALEALERQAERDKDFATVAEVLEQRVLHEGGDDAKVVVLQKLGALYADRLGDPARAMGAWRRLLSIAPGHTKTLRTLRDALLAARDYDGLTELYATSGDWEGLVEVLSGAADKASDPAEKVELSFRAADVYAGKLGAPERAFRAYERVLSVRPNDLRAAAALVPLYERDEKWSRLPSLYETLLASAREPEEKLELLQKLANVSGQHLHDRNAAFEYTRKAYELSPGADGALERFEKVARTAGQLEAFVETIRRAASDASLDAGERRALKLRVADALGAELGKLDEAIDLHRALVVEDERDERAVQMLDKLLRAHDRRDELRWLYETRVSRANTAAKIDLLLEWATLEEEVFAAPEEAIRIYRDLLAIVPQHGAALRALARLLRAAGDLEGSLDALSRDRDQRQGGDRASREVDVATLLIELRRPGEALDAAKRALELNEHHDGAIRVLEELLTRGETRASAATILEAEYAALGQPERQTEVLEVMIATAPSKRDRLPLYTRLADVLEEKLGAFDRAFDVLGRATEEGPSELALWDRMAVLSARTQRAQALVDAIARAVPETGETGLPRDVELDLAERAATLFDEKLGDLDRATPYLERILARDPANDRAFARLKQILTTRERWADLEALYERSIAATDDVPRRIDLLAEVALVAEDITGDRAKAIGYYERIAALEPQNDLAVRALDKLYASESRFRDLATLLRKRLEAATGHDAVVLKLRLAALYLDRLDEPSAALAELEELLEGEPRNNDARELTERILNAPGSAAAPASDDSAASPLRARAAEVLERVYLARDDVFELVRVLDIRLEYASDDASRRDLLRRLGELRDERIHDDAAAFEAFARYVPLAPEDEAVRHRMQEIGRRLGAHERVAETLVAAAKNAASPEPRADILSELAKLYEDLIGDATRAEATYKELLALDPNEGRIALPAAQALERLYAAAGRNEDLASMLRVQIGLEAGEAKSELLARLGDLSETVLEDYEAAIAAWRTRLEDDPNDARALLALDRLYERKGDYRALVDVLRARERGADDAESRRTLMRRIATTLADKLTDVPEAIAAYRAITDDFGPDRESLAALATLYEVSERYPELGETLETDLSLADSTEERLAVLARLGDVRTRRLGDIPGALEAYRQALTFDTSHPESRRALEALLDNADARREAASMLRPLYEAEGASEPLLRVLDIEAEYEDSLDGALALYAQAADVSEGPLADASRAFGYAQKGVRKAAAEAELPAWIARAERLAFGSGRVRDLVELLQQVATEIPDSELALDVRLKIADLARTHLADRALARGEYDRALELRPDDRRTLLALQSLHEEAGDAPALLSVLRLRAEAAESDDERKALLFQQATLCDATLGDASAAITVYEQILELGLDAEAIGALTRLYSKTERWADLVALYERELGASGTEVERRADLHHALGEVHATKLSDIERAFDEFEAALRVVPQHEATIASLERRMAGGPQSVRAAEMLEAVYLARLDWRNVMAALEARLAGTEDEEERRQLLRRLAKLHEEQEEDYRAALETTSKLFAVDVRDESTWAELERLARVANAEARLAEIYASGLATVESDDAETAALARRAGELFEAQGDHEKALAFFQRAYKFAPEDDRAAFDAIDRLLRAAGRARERVALFRDALEHRHASDERLAVLHTKALLEEQELGDDDAAIETYRAALDLDEQDATSLEALTRLYARRERYRDLAELTRRRAEQSALPDEEARFRLELGGLLSERLEDPSGALDEYALVLELVQRRGAFAERAVSALEGLLARPTHKARVVELLAPYYEACGDFRNLVRVNDERLALLDDDSERVAVLRANAELWEKQGGDLERALRCVEEAFVLDPGDGGTREELDRLAGATAQWDALSTTYGRALERADDMTKRELLAALARLHDARRDDPRRALEAWDALHRIDETDITPLEEMDALATLLSDWSTLVRVLVKKADLLVDDESRASTWRRVGEAKRDMLEDPEGATAAYERALELEPDSAFTVDNLIDLYEQRKDAEKLVALYRRRVELAGEDDEELKYRLLVEAATCAETGLGDRRQAIDLLVEALAVRAGDHAATIKLEGLYAAERMWPELLENLRLQAAIASDDAERSSLKKRIGALLAGELNEPEQALDAYREVLDAGIDDEAIAAVRKLGEAREELRGAAVEILEPVLRGGGRYRELIDVLEMRLTVQTEAFERAATLRSVARVAEDSLGDRARAEEALLRALAEEPHDAELHAEIERLAAAIGRDAYARYADALAERATKVFEADVTADLYRRLGRVAEAELQDDARAARAFAQAVEQAGDEPELLAALDRLYARLGNAKALAEILERRIALESDAHAQAELFHRLGSLQIGEFGERAQGLATLRQAVERVADHGASRAALEGLLDDPDLFDDAFDALEAAYRTTGSHEALAGLYERRSARAETPRDKVRAQLDLARVLEDAVRDPVRAQRAIEIAVECDPSDPDALAELERIAPITGRHREAIDAFGRALEGASTGQVSSSPELWVRLASMRRDRLSDSFGAEAAYEKALALDPNDVDVVRALEDLRRVPGRERELVSTLRRHAALEGEPSTKRDLLREAKAIAEGTLADRALAVEVLRELLAEDEADLWALEELTRLRELDGDFGEAAALLLRRAELVSDGAEALSLKHEAAKVFSERLADEARAIALYREILEQDPSDTTASSELRRLFAAPGRERDLARLLEHLIDVSADAGARATLRLELARLQSGPFESPEDAIATLRSILDESVGHAEATLALSDLLEKTGRDEELAELLDRQIEAARDNGDIASELELRVRLGEVLETRVKDATRALATYEAVLERDADHASALDAVARLAESRGDHVRAAEALERRLASTAGGPEAIAIALRIAAAREASGDDEALLEALRRALSLDPAHADVRARLRAIYERRALWAELADLLVGDADLLRAAHAEDVVPIASDRTPRNGNGSNDAIASVVASASSPPPSLSPASGPEARTSSRPPPSFGPSSGSLSIPPPPPVSPVVSEEVKLLRRAAEIHLAQRQSPLDAIPVLERAAALVPHDREVLLQLCDALTAVGRERDAAKVLERVIASFGTRRTKELSLYHHRLGRALASLGDKDVALAQYDLAFKIDPGSISVLRDLGILAFETNDLDRAQRTFRALLLQRLDPAVGISKGEVFYYLGEISAKQGDKVKAVQMYERAIENEPTLERAKQKLSELKAP